MVVTHCTDATNKHYDMVAYSELSYKMVKNILRIAGIKSGFKMTCRPVNTPAQRRGTVKYVDKTDMRPMEGNAYQYLPAKGDKDNKDRLVFGSKDFFQGESKSGLWKKVKASWGLAPISINKQIDRPPLDELDAASRLAGKVSRFLPGTPVMADFGRWTVEKLAWLVGWADFNVSVALIHLPGVERTADGNYWLPRNSPIPTPHTGRLVPYHRAFQPDDDDRLEDTVCVFEDFIVNKPAPIVEISDEDFYGELRAM